MNDTEVLVLGGVSVVEVASPAKAVETVVTPSNLKAIEVSAAKPAVVEVALMPPVVAELTLPGSQGPQGIPGQPANKLLSVAVHTLSGHRVLCVDTDGEMIYASCDVPFHAQRVVGISLNAVTPGGFLSIQSAGKVDEPSWTWDVTKPVYLSVDGLMTQIEPVGPVHKFSQVIGFPATPTSLFVHLQPPINLV